MVSVVFNISILLLPMSFYLLSISYQNNIKKISKHLLSITLIIQVILFIFLKDYTKSILLINIPLLISYLKRKELTSIILSILIAYYYVFLLNYNLYFIFCEYVLYYVIYYIVNKSYKVVSLIYIFVFIKSIVLSVETFYFQEVSNYFLVNYLEQYFEHNYAKYLLDMSIECCHCKCFKYSSP